MDVKKKSAPILPARLDWPSAIGNFLINFGTLDHLILVILKDNLESAEFENLRKKPLNDRVVKVAQYLNDKDRPTDSQEFDRLRKRLDPVRELRNHIAHGHFLIRQNEETKTWEMSISLPRDLDQEYLSETRHVSFDELRTSLNELTDLIEAFTRLAGFKPA